MSKSAEPTPLVWPIPDRDLSGRIAAWYPPPIARTWALYCEELGKATPTFAAASKFMFDCFEVSFHAIGLFSVADYLAGDEARDTSATREILLLRELRRGPSLGDKWRLLSEVSKTQQGEADLTGEVARTLTKGSRRSADWQALNAVVQARNEFSHKAGLSPHDHEEAVCRHGRVLESWMRSLLLFERHVVAIPSAEAEVPGVWECELLVGDRSSPVRERLQVADPVEPGELYLLSLGATRRVEPGGALRLSPWVVPNWGGREVGRPSTLWLLENPTTLDYSCPGQPSPASKPPLRLAPLDLLARLSGERPCVLGQQSKAVIEAVEAQTRAALQRFATEKVYLRDLHVRRADPWRSFEAFLQGERPTMILEGPSGCGKTSFLCEIAERASTDSLGWTCLLLDAHDLAADDEPIVRAVEGVMKVGSLASWLRDIRKSHRKQGWKLVILLDGLDKHPRPAALLSAVQRWSRWAITKPVQGMTRLVVSSSPAGLDSAASELHGIDAELYFTPTRTVEGRRGAQARLPTTPLGVFEPAELEDAYRRLAGGDRWRPQTDYQDLTEVARRVIRLPLLLRLVVEAYDGQQIPTNPISMRTLSRYADTVIKDRAQRDFTERLVDRMLAMSTRQVLASELQADPRLYDAYLDLSEASPFFALCRAQVLVVRRRVRTFPTEVSEECVEFALDRVFQFLLLVRALRRHGIDGPDALCAHLPALVEHARTFPTLRAAVVDMLVEILSPPGTCAPAAVLGRLLDASLEANDGWMEQLLTDLAVPLASGATEDATRAEDAGAVVADLVHGLLSRAPTVGWRVLDLAVDGLFREAHWAAAVVLLRGASEHQHVEPRKRFELQNTLVRLTKNQDHWEEAKRYSDANEALLPSLMARGDLDPALEARHLLNRFSVLYDVGERGEAIRLCERAHAIASSHGLPLEQAAISNNLGIAYVYFDQPERAERVLSEGLSCGCVNEIVLGHLELDRGLVRLFRWEIEHGRRAPDLLDAAERDVVQAHERFERAGYAQGILYGDATLGLIQQYRAELLRAGRGPGSADTAEIRRLFEAAEGAMERGRAAAEQLGEEWPHYGILADQALWQRAQPEPNLAEAERQAREAHERAHDNGDPEGTAITGMVLARILMDHTSEERLATAAKKLEEAWQTLVELEFFSAAARACAGMMEVRALQGLPQDPWPARREDCRARLPAAYAAWAPFAETFVPMDWKLLFLAELG
ncbi:MAG: hypothetical protein ABIO70_12470 [Pseudomonadota bacterium]